VLTLARPIILVLLMAVLGFAAHLAAESAARPEAIRTNILGGFSQRLVGDGSIATNLLGTRQTHFAECIAFSILANSRIEGGLQPDHQDGIRLSPPEVLKQPTPTLEFAYDYQYTSGSPWKPRDRLSA
jgi:hypothetical protein